MSKKTLGLLIGGGCLMSILSIVVAGVLFFFVMPNLFATPGLPMATPQVGRVPTWTPPVGLQATQEAIPAFTPPPPASQEPQRGSAAPSGAASDLDRLSTLAAELSPGVVYIQVVVTRGGQSGQGAGSGFILDAAGHIVTNNHVVAGAQRVTVVFDDGLESEAEIIGLDPHSDLAVIRANEMPNGVHALPLADSDGVQVGEWVLAIGSPFGLGTSVTTGIVSAVGRVIPSGFTPFGIPHAIQTDAAINPGNSGGPLLNLRGEVIGVNAQIASGGSQANAGVGFAIPSNVVRRVAPVLIEAGGFEWPWLGVSGTSVNLLIQQANDLDSQRGAYIASVVPDGPAQRAGLQGSSGTRIIDEIEVPVGGDVVVAVDGQPVADFAALLVETTNRDVGDTMELTIVRNGRRSQVTVELAGRSASAGSS